MPHTQYLGTGCAGVAPSSRRLRPEAWTDALTKTYCLFSLASVRANLNATAPEAHVHKPLAGLTRQNLGRELLGGVTLVAIAIPLNIGYAQIAGLPATAGLYALIVPTIIYALVVSSRQVVASPDAAAAALVASSIGGLAAAGSASYQSLALAQAIICGVMFMLLSVLKLVFLAMKLLQVRSVDELEPKHVTQLRRLMPC